MGMWHSFSFKISWPESQEPRWWVDIAILDCIVRDVVSDGTLHVELWRVHRRAARDKNGHEFTFDCFTAPDTAKIVDATIKQDKAFSFLRTNELLEKYYPGEGRAGMDEISEQTWPPELRKAWPFYINGVSLALLRLIEALKGSTHSFPDIKDADVTTEVIERSYQDLNRRLGDVWRDYGSSAFLHHMNAVFGYRPLVANPNVHGYLMSF